MGTNQKLTGTAESGAHPRCSGSERKGKGASRGSRAHEEDIHHRRASSLVLALGIPTVALAFPGNGS